MLTKQQLIDFEKKIEQLYSDGKIKAPIHLRNGNEDKLIEIFSNIKDQDYVFSTWASHLHALLKGVPDYILEQEILDGHSITLCFPEYNFYTSAIVGGICPIAVGVAWSNKRLNIDKHTYAFIGDMTSLTGIAHESILYAEKWNLPITFIIEDNGNSVGTPTRAVWNTSCRSAWENHPKVIYYSYDMTYGHAGIGRFISF